MGIKRVAVIGGGPCGLGAVKCLKEEGIEPVCFERADSYGGLWRYHEEDVDGLASVMKTTIINTSKEMGALSDFPPPDDLPNYMHNTEVCRFMNMYVQKFDLVRHVTVNKEVVRVELAKDYEATGRVTVAVRDTKTGEETQDTYDGVLVCIGHHVYPNMPTFPGMDKFKGKILHTHSLKKVDGFTDQVVAVVGVGNSGMDAAVEISAVSKQVYLSTRRGTWVLPRVGPSGIPLDLVLSRRWMNLMFQWLPFNFNCWVSERMINERFDHSLYNLKPKHRVWCQHPTVSDTIPIKLLSGTVAMRGNIEKFTEDGVIFENEGEVTKVDAVVFATGYQIKFPFLSQDITTVKNNEVNLYKYVYPPHLPHATIAILGLIQSVGAGFPIGEAQCRWASLLLNGKVKLPSKDKMDADIVTHRKINLKRYVHSPRHTIQVDYIDYLDDITSLFGAKPNFLKILFTDPRLYFALMIGPSLPYQYRLQGPHPWSGARDAILTYKKRVITPLKRDFKYQKVDSLAVVLKIVFLMSIGWILFNVFNAVFRTV